MIFVSPLLYSVHMSDTKRTTLDCSPEVKARVKAVHKKATDGVSLVATTDAIVKHGLSDFEAGKLTVKPETVRVK